MIAGRAPLAAGAAAQERDLVRRCRAGSEAAYTELIAAHGRRLFRLAVRLSGSRATAEDAAQATFRGAFRSIERGEERLPLAAWLTGRCVQEARRREPLAGRDRQRTRGHGLPAGQPASRSAHPSSTPWRACRSRRAPRSCCDSRWV